ncbi:LPS export ABC transporter ATP-binding protein [Mesoterricola silvestris]|uniref:ABC transporter ATP-binding protein n=1 Tax=Mesoterricola silvestris TaxID=2927979 RepID=A0AA48GWC8_9BACT|nr:LPS export ABC transporter ATP-binding protein [Mesoterricola silvestris]BDU73051.1 ABC transporter ATP-binding protein [Mesoterricola silvestris]
MNPDIRLEARNVFKRYGDRTVVRDVSLNVSPGEVVGLLGPNGAGKTTTFYMVVGVEAPDRGSIIWQDQDITGMPMHRRARQGIGYLPQESSVFRGLTVWENLLALAELQPVPKEEQRARCEKLLADFHLQKVRETLGMSLSGGERRRCEMARALVTDPRIMLLDEPFAGVDPKSVLEIQGLIADLKARGIGVLITDHNVRETLQIADRAYILADGMIMKHGLPQEIADDPDIRRVYLGDRFRLD